MLTFNTGLQDNFPIPMGIIAQDWHRTMISCNGVLCVTFSAFEAETIVVSRAWLSSIGMDTYIVGPLEDVPPAAEVIKREVSTTPGDAAVINFLDNMLASHGRQSVIYVCTRGPIQSSSYDMLARIRDRVVSQGPDETMRGHRGDHHIRYPAAVGSRLSIRGHTPGACRQARQYAACISCQLDAPTGCASPFRCWLVHHSRRME